MSSGSFLCTRPVAYGPRSLDLLPPLRKEALQLKGEQIYRGKQFFNDLFFDQCHHSEQGSEFVTGKSYDFLLEQEP
jgi:hypothetical protein